MNLSGATWRKSSYSGTETNCVEVAITETNIGIRDSKSPDSGMLFLTQSTAAALIDRLRR